METLFRLLISFLIAGIGMFFIVRSLSLQSNRGIDCGIIATKIDILTDKGVDEYKRLFKLYIEKDCPIIDLEKIRTM